MSMDEHGCHDETSMMDVMMDVSLILIPESFHFILCTAAGGRPGVWPAAPGMQPETSGSERRRGESTLRSRCSARGLAMAQLARRVYHAMAWQAERGRAVQCLAGVS